LISGIDRQRGIVVGLEISEIGETRKLREPDIGNPAVRARVQSSIEIRWFYPRAFPYHDRLPRCGFIRDKSEISYVAPRLASSLEGERQFTVSQLARPVDSSLPPGPSGWRRWEFALVLPQDGGQVVSALSQLNSRVHEIRLVAVFDAFARRVGPDF
jgi:hypothetical protein